ncbi:MAG: xanthine dehydrogenase family protein molybdopterin-binding subunit, partial [Proteobacteria bacterium]|nr:xanthine dehydrogenase family protein molybdopterin-binding subunit [Pseudomonadota bacterium]
RQFLKISSVAGTGLVLGIHLPNCSSKADGSAALANAPGTVFKPNAWIRIDSDDTITVIVNHSEMGQGISTALPMIVAEELEAEWSRVRFEIAPVANVYKHPAYGIQWTVSSRSVQTSWVLLREAGAAARELLIGSAARIWDVSPLECRAQNSRVLHDSSNRVLRYGELVDKTAGIPVPGKVQLKKPEQFKIIGRPLPRLDSRTKTDGSAVFGIDVRLPDILIATIVHPPVFGTKAESFNPRRTLAMPGVRQVVAVETGMAVVADTFWQAKKGMESLEIEWEKSENRNISTELLFERWTKMAEEKGKTCFEVGDVDEFFQKPGNRVEAAYNVPYQAHATPEPMNCTAHVQENHCEVWAPTQNQDGAMEIAARITGLSYDSIKVHTTYLGGGFGRRALVDYVGETVEISQAVKAPVKLIWSREEDIRKDFFRAATHNVLKAVLDDRGLPIAWIHRIVGADVFGQAIPKVLPAMIPRWVPRFLKNMAASAAESLMPGIISGQKAAIGAGPLSYGIPNIQVDFVNDDPGIPLCWWRSVAPSSNGFAVECFLDEIAATTGRDPYDLRYDLLSKSPRMRNVLELAASRAGWEEKPPQGLYRGIACHDFQSTVMTFIAEVSVNQSGNVKVHRVVCAVDCGVVVNPKIVEAQMQSGIVFGLTATLKSSITIKDGETEQSNFDDFPLLRMNEMPKVEVHIVPSAKPPTGIGEASVPVIGPAVANAVFAATGKRIRHLPILPSDLV